MIDVQRVVMRRLRGLYQRSRERKLALFFELTGLRRGAKILDVGANPNNVNEFENMLERRHADDYDVTAVTLINAAPLRRLFPNVRCIQADGCMLPFRDDAFDTVFSNAVIEHVGSKDQQRRFVWEMVRVAKTGFLTTPNYWFPIEQHMTLPLIHYLPWALRARVIRAFADQGRVDYMRQVRLLSARDFRSLFPVNVNVRMIRMRTTFWPEQLVAFFSR